MEKMTALDYAQAACSTMMRKFAAVDLPPKGHFHYHQGVFLSGVYQTYQLTQDESYFQYIKNWLDSIIDEDGNIDWFDGGQLDDIQPGILLFPMIERTGSTKYVTALNTLITAFDKLPKNKAGGFWHKENCPNQMWLDGLYMGGPICAEYGQRYQKPAYQKSAVTQVVLMRDKTRDPKTKLWYHAYDESRKMQWADPKTGCSPEFWGRSIGWVNIAILDELKYLKVGTTRYQTLVTIVKELLIAIAEYQSSEGRWYEVVNKPSDTSNWLENSCSSLFTAAYYRAVRAGILDVKYLQVAERGYQGVVNSLSFDETHNLLIGDVCIGTGVGDYRHYCDRPVSINDLHGVGAFLLMATAKARMDRD